jgi:hypothetical protein
MISAASETQPEQHPLNINMGTDASLSTFKSILYYLYTDLPPVDPISLRIRKK